MEEQTYSAPARKSRVERIASAALMVTAFLVPIFFIPGGLFSLPFAKSLIAYVGIIVSLILFIFSMLETGKFRLPANPVFYAAFAIPVVFLVSSLSSSSVSLSLVGYGFETGTFAFILLMFAFLYLVSMAYSTRERVFNSYLLFIASFGIVALFQVIRFAFGPDALSLGIFTSAASNMIGSWNDLGVFFSISALLALITLEMLPLTASFRYLLIGALALSIAFLAIVNLSTIWYVLGAFAFAIFVYILLSERARHAHEGRGTKISYPSLAVLAISIVFMFAGGFLGGKITSFLDISNLEVRPSWKATLDVAQHTLGENVLLGSGPNTFQEQWLVWKPEGINSTVFWNTDFNYGIGLIPTFLVTTGILGLLAWLAFFGAYLYVGMKAIFSGTHEPLPRYLIISSFFASLFLWVMMVVYVPNLSIILLTFFFTGLFIASAYNEGLLHARTVSFYQNSKMGFVSIMSFVFALVLAAGAGYFTTRNFVSSMYFQKSLSAASGSGDFDAAEASMERAIALRNHDIYYRSLSEIKILQLNKILTEEGASIDDLRSRFQTALGEAVEAGLKAIEAGPTNYENYVALGRIYESVVPEPFSIEGAYEKAKESYSKALELNPRSPEVLLLLARLEVAHGNLPGAKEYAERSIAAKQNYVDGYFLLSQVEVASGNIANAIASVESATLLAPNNPGIYFQLGLLKYNNKDFQGAAAAFERAIALVGDYANAKYFLGLSYDRLGRTADAVKQFEDLEETNPGNAEIELILENLRAGRDPFENAEPPLDDEPELRENPPVSQE